MSFKRNNTQLNLSPFTLQIGQLIVQQATQVDNSKLSTTLASVNKADIAINQGIILALHQD
ncbi:hypothetical protein, partial [Pseudoalteromonas sp. 41-MNA-CIBAN-0057]